MMNHKFSKAKIIAATVVSVFLVASVGAATFIASAASKKKTGKAAATIAASSLWDGNGCFEFTDNKEIPDYAKYGYYFDKTNYEYLPVNASDEDLHLEDWERYGLGCATGGGTMYYNNVVDIRNYTQSDELITFMMTPDVQGEYETGKFTFTLTDEEDPSQFLSFSLVKGNFNWSNFSMTNSSTTISSDNKNNSSVDVFLLWSHLNGVTYCSWNSKVQFLRNGYSSFSYDYKENTLYYSDFKGDVTKLFKFDDEMNSVGPENGWKGFTSGRVRMSITVGEMQTSKANFVILGAFNQKMNGEKLTDKAAPELSLEKVADVPPYAMVGGKYKVFDCKALDVVDGEVEYGVSITDPSGTEISPVDGAIATDMVGEYKIKYVAEDGSGNKSEKIKTVKCLAKADFPPLTITLTDEDDKSDLKVGYPIVLPKAEYGGGSGDLKTSVSVTALSLGVEINTEYGEFTPELPDVYVITYEVKGYIGDTATKTVRYTVSVSEQPVLKGEIQKIRKFYRKASNFISGSDREMTYDMPSPKVYDYRSPENGIKTAKYEIIASGNGRKQVISDGTFKPEAAFGDSITITYYSFFEDTPNEKYKIFEYTVPVEEKMNSAVSNLFDYSEEDVDVTVNSSSDKFGYIRFDTKDGVQCDEVAFTYALPLGDSNVSMSYRIMDYSIEDGVLMTNDLFVKHGVKDSETGKSDFRNYKFNYGGVKVELRDGEDASIGFDYTINRYYPSRWGNQTDMAYSNQRLIVESGGKKSIVDEYFDFYNFVYGAGGYKSVFKQGTPVKITYKDGGLYDTGGKFLMNVETGIDGKKFEGFPSHKVYMTVKLTEVTGKVGINLTTVGLTSMTTTYVNGEAAGFKDTETPKIVLADDLKLKYLMGDTVNVPFAYAYDDLSSHLDVKVTVYDPDYNVIDGLNDVPVRKGLSFKIQKPDYYTITYTTTDASGREGRLVISAKAIDNSPPTVFVVKDEALRVKAGQRVAIPEVQILDDVDDAEKLEVYYLLIDSDYGQRFIGKQNEYEPIEDFVSPSKKGRYTLRIVAEDTSHNKGFADITVIVE